MLASLVLCWTIALAPGSDIRSEAEALYERGQAKYETHDYVGAIADFTAAYSLVLEFDDELVREDVLARLAYNLARTHVSAYALDEDARHLEVARRLLADYRGHERQMGRDPDGDTDLKLLEAELLGHERARAAAQAAEPAPQPKPEPKPEPEPAPSPEPEPESALKARPRAQAQRNAGISMLAITPAFAGLAIAGGIMAVQARDDFELAITGAARLDARQRGRSGDALLGVGVAFAAASAITGVALLVVGRSGGDRKLALRMHPTGVSLEGRF